jgi:hypothetical protein
MLPAHDYAPAPETPAAIYAAYLVHLQRRHRGNTAYTQAARSFLRSKRGRMSLWKVSWLRTARPVRSSPS